MNPFERWDDWEWEKAAQELGKERGLNTRWDTKSNRPSKRQGWSNFMKKWSGPQKKTVLAALFFLTIFFSAQGTDQFSKIIHGLYQVGISNGNYYASLNTMAKEAIGLGGIQNKSIPVDVKMQGKFVPPISGPVMAGFGVIGDDGKGAVHNGIDIGSALGIPVVSPYSGVVTSVGEDVQLGKLVKVDFGDGWTAVLANLGDVSVQEGQPVKIGGLIGKVGLSAPLKKPWLHFELHKDGKPVNPLPYLVPVAK